MSPTDNELEETREIVETRRFVPKKTPDAPKKPSETDELKAKTAELSRRLRRARFATFGLGALLAFAVWRAFCAPSVEIVRPENADRLPAPVEVSPGRPPLDEFAKFDDAPFETIFPPKTPFESPAAPSRRSVFSAPPTSPFKSPGSNSQNAPRDASPPTTANSTRNADVSGSSVSNDTRVPSAPNNSNVSNDANNPNGANVPNDASADSISAQTPIPNDLRVVRIAGWNLAPFDFAKLADAKIGSRIARLAQEFDLVATQGICAKNRAVVEGLAYWIEREGGDYGVVVSGPNGRDAILAVFYDRRTLVVDRSAVSDAFDSRGRLFPPALVATFRPVGVPPSDAFTFQIVDAFVDRAELTRRNAVKTDNLDAIVPVENADQTAVAPPTDKNALKTAVDAAGEAIVDVLQTLRNRSGALGTSEDDFIVVGDFGADVRTIAPLGRDPNLVAALSGVETDADGGSSANILFDSTATVEYVERFGVVDLADYFGISEEEAREISLGRPIWADFSVYEGGFRRARTPDASRESLRALEYLPLVAPQNR